MARPRGNPKARTLEIAKRRRQVVEYRAMGLSSRAIGERLGVSHTTIDSDIEAAMKENAQAIKSAVETSRFLANERLDMARSAIAAKVRTGDLGAVDRWVKIEARAAKLNGLDKPVQFEDVTPPVNRRLGNLSVTELQLFEMLLQKVEGRAQDEDAEEDEE